MSKEFMKVYHMPFKAQEIKNDNFTNFRLQFDQAFEEMTKSFSEQQDEIIANYLYEKYKDTKVSDVWVLSKPYFEKFLLEMLPKWKEPKQYVDELKLVEKKLNALDLLMQELDCKDFADLRKYARCGYQTFRNAKGANYDNIIIDEAQEPKHYLKWEDLEFKEEEQKINILMSGNAYYLYVYREEYVEIRAIDGWHLSVLDGGYFEDKQFFNDLHLERVEE